MPKTQDGLYATNFRDLWFGASEAGSNSVSLRITYMSSHIVHGKAVDIFISSENGTTIRIPFNGDDFFVSLIEGQQYVLTIGGKKYELRYMGLDSDVVSIAVRAA